MSDQLSDLEKARKFFGEDFYATKATGIVIDEVGDHYARCSMEITRNHQNAYGGVMGGATFTLADYTFAVASNFNQVQTVSVTSQINFIGMAKGKKLLSESHLIKDGRSTCLYQIEIKDELGNKIAFVTISGMKLVK
ncbi:MAG: PaaI family thioesterase [Treponema sp.]|nr:PaaI family thioesterase [Treponema sp.]